MNKSNRLLLKMHLQLLLKHFLRMFDAWDLCLKSHEDFPGVRGSNPRLTFEELQQAAHDSDIVRQLKQADEPIADSAYMKTLLAKDALHALAN